MAMHFREPDPEREASLEAVLHKENDATDTGGLLKPTFLVLLNLYLLTD